MVAGLAGGLAGVPGAAVAYAVPDKGPVRLSSRWWTGVPAPCRAVVAAALAAGASTALVAARLGALAMLPALWLVAVLGVVLAVIDIRRQRLPHPLTGVLWAASAACLTWDAILRRDVGPALRAGICAAVVLGAFLALALALPGQLGLGDVNLAGVLAVTLAWIGVRALVTGLAAGLTLQAILAVAVLARHHDPRQRVAMGPALLAGWLVAVCVGR